MWYTSPRIIVSDILGNMYNFFNECFFSFLILYTFYVKNITFCDDTLIFYEK